MFVQVVALAVLVLIFAVATWKPVHLGLLGLTAAFGVGFFLADESFADIMEGFPVSILVLLVGVTYLFAIAREAGVVDWIIHRAVSLVRGRIALLPWIFFALAVLLASMGSPLACVALTPVAMIFVGRQQVDPALMGLAVVLGGSAGGFAPTSLYGLITNGIAAENGLPANPMLLYGASIGFNAVLMACGFLMFGGSKLLSGSIHNARHGSCGRSPEPSTAAQPASNDNNRDVRMSPAGVPPVTALDPDDRPRPPKLSAFQAVSLASLAALISLVVGLSIMGLPADVGVIALSLAVLVSVLFPARTKPAVQGIDWSTILLVGGIVSYVGVLQRIGVLDLLGTAAESIDQPLLAAFVLCLIGALISAFASTTGIIGALIPMAVPLMASGEFAGYGLVVALAISSSLVDTMPFSTAGAAAVASAPEDDRLRMNKIYMRWGFAMVVIGPVLTISTLVLPGLL